MRKAFNLSIISFGLLVLTFLFASMEALYPNKNMAPIIISVLLSFILSIVGLTITLLKRKELKSKKGLTALILNLLVIIFFVSVSTYAIVNSTTTNEQHTTTQD
tara:strand:+ start:329 stop:640 length:312 start_codon:yes stop_codon:yes gene_type:complete